MPHKPASPALSHIKVLDLSRVRSGPTAARQLADWGADVIKIEPPQSIEPDGTLGAARHTADFQNLQRNKRSLTLNLKDERGLDLFKRLVADADVVIENFRPDVKTRLGIDYEALKAVNPKIILASISGFGQSGPYVKRPGFDQIAQGMGGLMSITGMPGMPMRAGIPIADLSAGLFCALGIMVALVEREKSGEGQWLHTSLMQAQIFMLDFQAARWLMKGEVAPPAGNDHPTSVPTGLFKSADGTINIAVAGEAIWQRFCGAVGRGQWAEDARFATNTERLKNRDELNFAIQEIVAQNASEHWIGLLTKAGVPCGPVYTIDKMFDDPQVRKLGIAAPIETVPFGKTECIAQPVELTRTPSSITSPPPESGAHTTEILEELGMTANEIKDLQKQSVV